MNNMEHYRNAEYLYEHEKVSRIERIGRSKRHIEYLSLQLGSSAEAFQKLATYWNLSKELFAALSAAQISINTANKLLGTKIYVIQDDVKRVRSNQQEQNTEISIIRKQSCISRIHYEPGRVDIPVSEMNATEFINSAKRYANMCKRVYRPQWARDTLLFSKIDQSRYIINEELEERCRIMTSAIISKERLQRQNIVNDYNKFYEESVKMQISLASIREKSKVKVKSAVNPLENMKLNPPKAAWKCQMRFMLEDAWEGKKKIMHEALDYLTALKMKQKDEYKRVKKLVVLRKEMTKQSYHHAPKNSQRTTALTTAPPPPPPIPPPQPTQRPPSSSVVTNAIASINTVAVVTPSMVTSAQQHLTNSASSPDIHQLRHIPQHIPCLVSSSRNVIEIPDPNPRNETNKNCKSKKQQCQLPVLMSTEELRRK